MWRKDRCDVSGVPVRGKYCAGGETLGRWRVLVVGDTAQGKLMAPVAPDLRRSGISGRTDSVVTPGRKRGVLALWAWHVRQRAGSRAEPLHPGVADGKEHVRRALLERTLGPSAWQNLEHDLLAILTDKYGTGPQMLTMVANLGLGRKPV